MTIAETTSLCDAVEPILRHRLRGTFSHYEIEKILMERHRLSRADARAVIAALRDRGALEGAGVLRFRWNDEELDELRTAGDAALPCQLDYEDAKCEILTKS